MIDREQYAICKVLGHTWLPVSPLKYPEVYCRHCSMPGRVTSVEVFERIVAAMEAMEAAVKSATVTATANGNSNSKR